MIKNNVLLCSKLLLLIMLIKFAIFRRIYEQDFNELPNTIDYKRSQTIIPQLNRVILNVLGKEVDYLQDCQVDVNPNLESFWFLGGQEASSSRRSKRKANVEAKGKYKARYVKPDDPIEE